MIYEDSDIDKQESNGTAGGCLIISGAMAALSLIGIIYLIISIL